MCVITFTSISWLFPQGSPMQRHCLALGWVLAADHKYIKREAPFKLLAQEGKIICNLAYVLSERPRSVTEWYCICIDTLSSWPITNTAMQAADELCQVKPHHLAAGQISPLTTAAHIPAYYLSNLVPGDLKLLFCEGICAAKRWYVWVQKIPRTARSDFRSKHSNEDQKR